MTTFKDIKLGSYFYWPTKEEGEPKLYRKTSARPDYENAMDWNSTPPKYVTFDLDEEVFIREEN